MNKFVNISELLENGEKLKKFLEENHVNFSALAEKLNKSRTTLYSWLSENKRLDEILEASNINIDKSITQNQSGGDSSMQFAGHENKGKVQEINHFKCAYNVAELSKLVNDGIDRAMLGYEKLLTEKDERIKDLKEIIEILKGQKK